MKDNICGAAARYTITSQRDGSRVQCRCDIKVWKKCTYRFQDF